MTTDKRDGPDIVNPVSPEAVAAAEAEKPPEPTYDPTALQRAFDATTRTGPDAMSGVAGEIIPRRRVNFVVDVGELAPGIFPEDIKIGLVALTSAMEIKVTTGITDPAEAVQLTAKASLETLNGAPIPQGDQVDFVWEILGPGGRQIVLTMYQQIGAVTPAGMGKAQESSSLPSPSD